MGGYYDRNGDWITKDDGRYNANDYFSASRHHVDQEFEKLGEFGGLKRKGRQRLRQQQKYGAEQLDIEDERFAAILAEIERYWGQANELYQKELGIWDPYAKAGAQAVQDLSNFREPTADEVRESPDYQFRLEEGERLAQAQQNAAGRSGRSAGAQKELTRFGQDHAMTHWRDLYDREFQRLNTLVGYGMKGAQGQATAVQNMHGANTNVANLASNNFTTQAGNRIAINQNEADTYQSAYADQQQQSADRTNAIIGGVSTLAGGALGLI